MPSISVKTGPHKGKAYPIEADPLTMGREENQTIQILDHGVSRAHAEIFRIGDMCFIRDLDSTNGTFVNNARITEESLNSGDELLIGTTILAFEGPSPVDSDSGVAFVGKVEDKLTVPAVELKLEPPTGAVPMATVGREVESKHLALVSRAGRILRREDGSGKAVDRVVREVVAAIGAAEGFLLAPEREGGRLIARVVVTGPGQSEPGKISRTIVGRAQKSGMPILLADISEDDRVKETDSTVFREIRSIICVPILAQDRVEGILYLHSGKEGRVFTVEDLERVTSVGLQLSMSFAGSAANERLRRRFRGTIEALVTAMEIVDPKSQGHARRVADFSVAVGSRLGMSHDDLHQLRLAALLHDVGLLEVNHSQRGLPDPEQEEKHVRVAEKLLSEIDGFEKILPGIRYHHERADGSGFPYRMKNEEIPLLARIVIVANALDDAFLRGEGGSLKDAVTLVARGAGKEFDEKVVDALLECQRSGDLHVPPLPKP